MGVPARWCNMNHRSSFCSMHKMSLPSLCISELVEKPRPSTHRRRLFTRSALGMIGMQYLTDMAAPLRGGFKEGAEKVPRRTNRIPQRLKPHSSKGSYGTAEAVP